jgi:hypothetical protein
MSPKESISKLKENIVRWTEEVSSGEDRGTLLEGIAGKAANSFENLLRESLEYYLAFCDLSYDSELAPDFEGKPLSKLTIGQVVQSFEKLDEKLTLRLRSIPNAQEYLKNRRLVGSQKNVLQRITKLRNLLHHNREVFADNENTLTTNTVELLSLVKRVLVSPLFEVIAKVSGP